MASKYARAAGGNWNTDATWSTTSGGSADTTKPTASDDVFLDGSSGNVTIDAASVAKSVTCTGYTGTLTHNAFSLTVSGNITFVSGMTYTPLNTSVIVLNAAGVTLTTGGKLLPSLTSNNTMTLGDNLSFMASKAIVFNIFNTVNLNGKTISGNSVINRILIRSGTLGTAKQITVSGGTFANADFQDIIFSNATDLDLSAITGNSGDCGGNSITGGGTTLTFTTSATQTWSGTSGGNWSTNAWTTRVPLPQDDVVISSAFSASQTVTADMPRLGRSIDWTGTTGSSLTWRIGATTNALYGSLTLVSGISTSGTGVTTFNGRGSFSITSAGVQFTNAITITCVGGTYTLNDAFSTAGALNPTNGTFNANNFNVTCSNLNANSNLTMTIIMGSGTWTLTRTSGNIINITTTNLTFSGESALMIISGASASTRNFNGGGLTYGTLTYNVAGSTGELDIAGSNSFHVINFSDASNARSLKFTAGTTTTILDKYGFNVQGTSGKLMTVDSITAATHTLAGTDIQACNYLSVKNSVASGGQWFAGYDSTNVSGNTGWIFASYAKSLSALGA